MITYKQDGKQETIFMEICDTNDSHNTGCCLLENVLDFLQEQIEELKNKIKELEQK